MSLSSFLSSFLPSVHADAPEAKEGEQDTAITKQEAQEEPQEEPSEPAEEESTEGAEGADAEEEAPEPEDLHPIIREECKQTAKCAPLAAHFQHCQEKVEAGHGYKGEDCVEELCKLHRIVV